MSWGASAWGGGAWGGGATGTLDLLSTLAFRENVIRLGFSNPVYLSRLLDAPDASRPDKYSVTAVPGTIGMDGEPVRDVVVVESAYAVDPVRRIENPDIIDLTLDRPMTPYPALYVVRIQNIFSQDLSISIVDSSLQVGAVFKRIEPPQYDIALPSRDIGNPMTLSAALDPLPDPNDPLNLGTIRIDDSGDYAYDEGLVNLKKRVLRRLITTPGAFAHLPGYGVGVPVQGKRLATAAIQSQLSAQAEAQISREPDVRRVSVSVLSDPSVPGLVRFRIAIIPKTGAAQRFDVPFLAR